MVFALFTVGNGLINDNVNGVVLKTASAAVLGGTISEIGGGKFANGAITGAYGMLFNDMTHDKREQLARSAERRRDEKAAHKYCNVFAQDMMEENDMAPSDKALYAGEWADKSIEKAGGNVSNLALPK